MRRTEMKWKARRKWWEWERTRRKYYRKWFIHCANSNLALLWRLLGWESNLDTFNINSTDRLSDGKSAIAASTRLCVAEQHKRCGSAISQLKVTPSPRDVMSTICKWPPEVSYANRPKLPPEEWGVLSQRNTLGSQVQACSRHPVARKSIWDVRSKSVMPRK